MTLIRAHTRTRTLRAREAYTENGGTSDTSRVQALDLDRRCRLCDLSRATEEGLYCARCYAWQMGDSPGD
jgi:hypothetical protein